MDFPIVSLLDDEVSEMWLWKHLHPEGVRCPHCTASVAHARVFRRTRRSHVPVYRCGPCQGIYTVYSRTLFAAKQLRPAQVVLLLRGICKGEPTATLARELGVSRMTVHALRQQLQAQAQQLQPTTPVQDRHTETDEMFQNAGEKRRKARQSRRPATAAGQQTPRTWHVCQ